jgi:amidase
MTTWITRLDGQGSGLRVAVKDLIDLAGVPTTAGSRAVADRAAPATADAACVAGLRAAEAAGTARIVGKANLHELALGVTGINPWFGTPLNPLDASRVPGGSSSGSAVAVGADEADVAYGSDTGGSVRIPAACCGVVGLKTTWGRVPVSGVWPLAPSLDTVGPLARDVAGVAAAMALLEPGFTGAPEGPATVGRFHLPANPDIERAIDVALAQAEVAVHDVRLPGWAAAGKAGLTLLAAEAWALHGELATAGRLGPDVAARLRAGSAVTSEERAAIGPVASRWSAELAEVFSRVEVIALPTLLDFPPLLTEAEAMMTIRATLPVNVAGLPALAIPVPTRTLPASIQLVGPAGSEERLVAIGRRIEAAVAR